ncbi:MAG: hypothetical protein V1674_06635 [Candidatus Omnitrophota bacterium]
MIKGERVLSVFIIIIGIVVFGLINLAEAGTLGSTGLMTARPTRSLATNGNIDRATMLGRPKIGNAARPGELPQALRTLRPGLGANGLNRPQPRLGGIGTPRISNTLRGERLGNIGTRQLNNRTPKVSTPTLSRITDLSRGISPNYLSPNRGSSAMGYGR